MTYKVSEELRLFFPRTIGFSKKLDFSIDYLSSQFYDTNSSLNKTILTFYSNFCSQLNVSDPKHNFLKELISIEFEKINLNIASNLKNIKKAEKLLNVSREENLTIPFKNLFLKKIVKNPLVHCYESYFEFVDNGSEDLYQKLMIKGDYYFLFQQTGLFDESSQTSILEFPLQKLEYFFIDICQKPKKLINVIGEFKKVFEIPDESSEKLLDKEIQLLITKLIFRKFLVFFEKEEYNYLEKISISRNF